MTKAAMATSFLVVLSLGFAAHAAEEVQPSSTENSAKIDDVTPTTNKMPEDQTDIDELITNNLMRAQTGSKSKLSISNSITYNGGMVDQPFSSYVPNISAGTGNTTAASLTDSIAGKYSLNTQNSLLAGFGARWISPLNGTQVPAGYTGNKYDAMNPYVKYQYVYKWEGIQNAVTVGPTAFTYVNLTRMGYVGNVNLQQNSVYEIAHSGVSVGALANVVYTAYNSESDPYRSEISDYSGGFQPFIEYQITDRINLRTFWGLLVYEHIVSEPRALTFYQDVLTQSVGVGIKVVRDVFLYPNVSFVPYDIRSDRTNAGLSANINLF